MEIQIAPIMSYTEWLRRQVKHLEDEIRVHPIFDSETPASPDELRALRETIVLHTFLKQQLLRRECVDVSTLSNDSDQQYVMVPVPIAAYSPK